MVVAEGVAGVVFVEVEVAVEVGGVVAGVDELEDGEVSGGVGEWFGELGVGGEVVPEVEMVGSDASVQIVEGADAVVVLADVVEHVLIVFQGGGALFDGGFEVGLGFIVEPVVDAAFGELVVFGEGTDGEFAVGFAGWVVFEAVIELHVFVELVEVGEGLDEGEGAEGVFVFLVAGDVGELGGIAGLVLDGAEFEEVFDGLGGELARWEELFSELGIVGGAEDGVVVGFAVCVGVEKVFEGGGLGAFVVDEPEEAGLFVFDEPLANAGVGGVDFFGDAVEGDFASFMGVFVLEGVEVGVAVSAEFFEVGVTTEVGEFVEFGFQGFGIADGRKGIGGHLGFQELFCREDYILHNLLLAGVARILVCLYALWCLRIKRRNQRDAVL